MAPDAAGTGGLGEWVRWRACRRLLQQHERRRDAAGAGNIIAFNDSDGVLVDSSIGNAILGNSIFSNTGTASGSSGLGIDLVSAELGVGVTANDPGDGDPPGESAGNNYQNFPILSSAVSIGGSTTIQGTFNSTPSTNNFRLEFFSNSSCNDAAPLDYGEGKTYLGFTTVNTNASGDAGVNIVFPVTIADGWFITATATDPANNTSEFSQCQPVSGPPTPTPTVPSAPDTDYHAYQNSHTDSYAHDHADTN